MSVPARACVFRLSTFISHQSLDSKLTFVFFFSEMVKRLFVITFLEHTIAHTKRAMPMPRFISFAFAVENAINLCEKRGGPLLELGTPKFEEIECDQNDLQNTQIMICRCLYKIYRIQPSNHLKWDFFFFCISI